MLAEAVLAGAEKLRRPGDQSGRLYPSNVSLCPRRTYLTWIGDREPPSQEALLRMNDGHYQEEEMIDDLERAGFEIVDQQRRVTIGPSVEHPEVPLSRQQMTGRIDGKILVNEEWCILDCKAMSSRRISEFREQGFQSEPSIKVQMQLYLHSAEIRKEGITKAIVYAKNKDNCRPFDRTIIYSEVFASALVKSFVDIIEGWKPPAERTSLCLTCPYTLKCWGAHSIDFSGVKVISLPEVVAKWKRAKFHQVLSKELMDEVRPLLVAELGDRKAITVDDLKILRVSSHRGEMDKILFVKKYGAAALTSIWTEKDVEQIRITEV